MSSSDIELALPPPTPTTLAVATQPPPETPFNQYLTNQISATTPVEARDLIVCKTLLQGQALADAQTEAAQLFGKMLANTTILVTYGSDVFLGLNRLADALLKQVERVSIPEVSRIMHELNGRMRGMKRKYDMSDEHARRSYEGWKRGLLERLHFVQDIISEFMEDVTSVERQLAQIEAAAHGKEEMLLRYVIFYDAVYKQNELELKQVVKVIAILELILDHAVEYSKSIPEGDRHEEQVAAVAQLIEQLKIKITDFKSRLFVGYSTSPNVRMARQVDVTVAQRLDYMVVGVIPLMKLILFQWRTMLSTKNAAELVDAIASAGEQYLVEFSRASAVTLPQIQEMAEKPTLGPQSMYIVATALQQASDGIIAAIQAGDQRRAELDDAMAKTRDIMSGAVAKVNNAIIQSVLEPGLKPLELPALPAASN